MVKLLLKISYLKRYIKICCSLFSITLSPIILLLSLLCFSFASSLFAEILIFKNGSYVKCKIISQDKNSIEYSAQGVTRKVSKKKIHRLVLGNSAKDMRVVNEEVNKLTKKISKAKATDVKPKEVLSTQELDTAEKESEEYEDEINQDLKMQLDEIHSRLYALEAQSKTEPTEGGSSSIPSSELSTLKKDVSELKKKTNRIERFLEIDPDIRDYYSRDRSMWDLVWRSALIPGWGHQYARESTIGTTYTTLFIPLVLAHVGLKVSYTDAKKDAQNRLITNGLVQPYILSNFLQSTVITDDQGNVIPPPASNSKLPELQTIPQLFKFTQSLGSVNTIKKRSTAALQIAGGLYAFQLIHAMITGYFWARKPKVNFEEFSDRSEGFFITSNPGTRVSVRGFLNHSNYEVGYNWSF
jgi:hypothetical protein